MAKDKKRKKDKSQAPKKGGPTATRSADQNNAAAGGRAKVDKVGPTGVYPLSTVLDSKDPEIEKAPIVAEGEFGQGERGIEGYFDSGDSEVRTELELLKSSGDTETSGANSDNESKSSKR